MAALVEVERTENEENSSYLVGNLPEIIEHILKHLPMKAVNKCARVNRQWRDAVKKAKSRRHQLGWLWHDASNASHNVEETIADCVERLAMEPCVAILFCSTRLHESSITVPSHSTAVSSRHPRAAKQEKMALVEYLHRVLPPSCCIKGVATDGIIGMDWVGHHATELENCKAASCLLLPSLEGVDVYNFTMDMTMDYMLKDFRVEVPHDFPDPLVLNRITGIPHDKKARVILFYHAENFYGLDSDLGYALLKHYGQVVVAGVHADELLPEIPYHDTASNEPTVLGLAFCGENIKMASIVMPSRVKSKQAVEAMLKKLQNAHVPATNRIGFMFACVGRGRHFHQEANVESCIFHKLFPNTPLFGCFGNGEVGYDYLPDYSRLDGHADYTVVGTEDDFEDGVTWDLPDIHHSYTTVFVLMSLG